MPAKLTSFGVINSGKIGGITPKTILGGAEKGLISDSGTTFLSRTIKIVNAVSYVFIFVILGLMTVLVSADITIRSLFGFGIEGTIEISEYLLVIIGFLGLSETQARKGHISVELVVSRISLSERYIIQQISRIILISFCFLFTYAGIQKAISAFSSGETSWFGIHILPVWYFRWIVPIGFVLLSFQLIEDVLESSKRRKTGVLEERNQHGGIEKKMIEENTRKFPRE